MLSYPMLFINIKLCIAVTFSGILTNFPEQKLAIIALNNLNKNLIALTTVANFFKKKYLCPKSEEYFRSKTRRKLDITIELFLS